MHIAGRKHPNYGEGAQPVSFDDAVRYLGISRDSLMQYTARHPDELAYGNQVNIGRYVRWRVIVTAEQAENKIRDRDESVARDPKERKLMAEAELVEIKVAEQRGLLAPLAVVEEMVTNQYSNTRAKLRGLPAKLAGLVLAAKDENEAKEILEVEIDAALTELAESEIFVREPEEASGTDDAGGDAGSEAAPEMDD